ncbi:hypothetical protein [Halobiforma nitratireducens]|uniref:Uncharacterized protein n=1 Tax=Halobiforma nitratireducens JCM 10879 TaxID=1227454 RepID=M0L1M0_9EURY|nr:hypothetical protein [Halobiforma nitratireducens]EMA27446.1 hypothetical protein C446_17706 [Halobiforma nitratireducens JCM 10879]
MVVIAAFKDGWTALLDNPGLLAAGFAAAGSQLATAMELIGSVGLAAARSIVWCVVPPVPVRAGWAPRCSPRGSSGRDAVSRLGPRRGETILPPPSLVGPPAILLTIGETVTRPLGGE